MGTDKAEWCASAPHIADVHGRGGRFVAAALLALGLSGPAAADRIPHVGPRGEAGFAEYQQAEGHRAFVIAPGGAWAWRTDEASADTALEAALAACAGYTEQACVPYAIDDRIVFDAAGWPRLWRTALPPAPATGMRHGERLPDLAFADRTGHAVRLSALRGRITIVHFWGSWCPPCRREFPGLQQLQRRLDTELPGEVALVLLQVREPFADSLRWARENRFDDVPLRDSGATADSDRLTLADGRTLPDRAFSAVFPSSYLLDRNGTVILSHRGPVHDWLEYLPFLKELAGQRLAVTAGN